MDSDGLLFKPMEGYWQGNKIYKELGHLDKDNKTIYFEMGNFLKRASWVPERCHTPSILENNKGEKC